MTNPQFRLLNFQVKNEKGKGKRGRDNKEFIIQMFGMNESGETCSIFVKNYTPFFYVKVADHWGKREKRDFIQHLKMEITSNLQDSNSFVFDTMSTSKTFNQFY